MKSDRRANELLRNTSTILLPRANASLRRPLKPLCRLNGLDSHMRNSGLPVILVVLYLTASCSWAQSSEYEESDFPVPFPYLLDEQFPPQLDPDADGRANFYSEIQAIGHETASTTYLYLHTRSENSYLAAGGTDPDRYFEQGMNVGPHPEFFDNPRAPVVWDAPGFAVCEEKRDRWHCNRLETEKKYLGLRLIRGGETYYGWMLIGANPKEKGVEILIYDLAVSPNAGEPILTGEHP